jgi:hypothetical protein
MMGENIMAIDVASVMDSGAQSQIGRADYIEEGRLDKKECVVDMEIVLLPLTG